MPQRGPDVLAIADVCAIIAFLPQLPGFSWRHCGWLLTSRLETVIGDRRQVAQATVKGWRLQSVRSLMDLWAFARSGRVFRSVSLAMLLAFGTALALPAVSFADADDSD